MRVLVFEYVFEVTGHRIPYASLICDAIASRGDCPILALPQSVSGDETLQAYLPPDRGGYLHPYRATQYRRPGLIAREMTRSLLDVISQVRPDYVLVPTGDLIAFTLGWKSILHRRTPEFSGDTLLLRGEFVHRHVGRVERLRKRVKWEVAIRSSWNRIALLDPLVWNDQIQKHPNLELCPDPVPVKPLIDKHTARKRLGLPSDRRLILSVGNQNRIKGVDLLLDAYRRCGELSDSCLVLAGPQADEVKQQLHDVSQRLPKDRTVIAIDRFISESEFREYLVAADVVSVPYRKTDRPSGVISRCVSWGIPIVASGTGWPRWAAERLGGGWYADPFQPEAFGAELCRALENAHAFQQSTAAKRFSDFNTAENFQGFWLAGMERKKGNIGPHYRRFDL